MLHCVFSSHICALEWCHTGNTLWILCIQEWRFFIEFSAINSTYSLQVYKWTHKLPPFFSLSLWTKMLEALTCDTTSNTGKSAVAGSNTASVPLVQDWYLKSLPWHLKFLMVFLLFFVRCHFQILLLRSLPIGKLALMRLALHRATTTLFVSMLGFNSCNSNHRRKKDEFLWIWDIVLGSSLDIFGLNLWLRTWMVLA